MFCTTLVAMAVISQGAAAAPADPRIDAALAGARKVLKATADGDAETIASLTHPQVIERLGGRERMIEVVRRGLSDMKDQNMHFKRVGATRPEQVVEGAGGLFCVAPTLLELEVPEGLITLRSFLIGFSTDGGTTWVYIDGAPGPEAVRAGFPEIPAALALPQRQKPAFRLKDAEDKNAGGAGGV